jgi:excisionase family DNA binding protein
MDTPTLTLADAAALLHVHPDTLKRMAQVGDVPATKPGRSWVFMRADLLDWLRERAIREAAERRGA